MTEPDTEVPSGFPDQLRARFRPTRVLGQGGMGLVFLAQDLQLERLVAVKLLRGEALETMVRRFLREAEALAAIRHPNVIEVYDHGQLADGAPYLVLEHLEGTTLEHPPPDLDPLATLLPIADALEELHRAGLIHRDLKPANLFRTDSGRSVLLDFGLVRRHDRTALTRTGSAVGTPAYMAPEMLRGEAPTPAADWYGLGATLFTLLEGKAPFTTEEILALLLGEERPPLRFAHTPPESDEAHLVAALLDPDPGRRPASRRALEAIRHAPPPGATVRAPAASGSSVQAIPTPRGRPRPLRVAAGLWLLLAIGLAWWGLSPGAPPASPTVAPPEPHAVLAAAGLAPLPRNPEGYRRLRNLRDQSVMIYVPAGPFVTRGGPDSALGAPPRRVELPPYLVGEHAVTMGCFRRFSGRAVTPRGHAGVDPDHLARLPMVSVDHAAAQAYCRWAGGRLIRFLEFERAASGHDGRRYPWGDQPPEAHLANFGHTTFEALTDPLRFLREVGSYPEGRSPIGALDLAGNAATWTDDRLARPGYDEAPEPGNLGGGYMVGADALSSWYFRTWPAEDRGTGLGLRLVREVSPELAAAIEGIEAWPPAAPAGATGWTPLGTDARGHREFRGPDGTRWVLLAGGPGGDPAPLLVDRRPASSASPAPAGARASRTSEAVRIREGLGDPSGDAAAEVRTSWWVRPPPEDVASWLDPPPIPAAADLEVMGIDREGRLELRRRRNRVSLRFDADERLVEIARDQVVLADDHLRGALRAERARRLPP